MKSKLFVDVGFDIPNTHLNFISLSEPSAYEIEGNIKLNPLVVNGKGMYF